MRKKIFIWDLDDTLVDNVHDYAQPLLDACSLIIRTLGSAAPHVTGLITLEQEIDKKRVGEINLATGKPFGYSKERFPGSMVALYDHICERSGKPSDERVRAELKRIGFQAFDKNRYRENIKPGAIHLLKSIRDAGHANLLITKGDEQVQQMKVDALLDNAKEKLFDEIRIVENAKDPALFLELAKRHMTHPEDAVCAVGNDYHKDVLPALKANTGFVGIWIPVETWETLGQLERIAEEVDKKRCLILAGLAQMEGLALV